MPLGRADAPAGWEEHEEEEEPGAATEAAPFAVGPECFIAPTVAAAAAAPAFSLVVKVPRSKRSERSAAERAEAAEVAEGLLAPEDKVVDEKEKEAAIEKEEEGEVSLSPPGLPVESQGKEAEAAATAVAATTESTGEAKEGHGEAIDEEEEISQIMEELLDAAAAESKDEDGGAVEGHEEVGRMLRELVDAVAIDEGKEEEEEEEEEGKRAGNGGEEVGRMLQELGDAPDSSEESEEDASSSVSSVIEGKRVTWGENTEKTISETESSGASSMLLSEPDANLDANLDASHSHSADESGAAGVATEGQGDEEPSELELERELGPPSVLPAPFGGVCEGPRPHPLERLLYWRSPCRPRRLPPYLTAQPRSSGSSASRSNRASWFDRPWGLGSRFRLLEPSPVTSAAGEEVKGEAAAAAAAAAATAEAEAEAAQQ